MRLPKPTDKAVRKVHSRLSAGADALPGDKALQRLFRTYPQNSDLSVVVPKVATLNALYRTNIFNVLPVARRIVDARIDRLLSEKSIEAVLAIQDVRFGSKTRSCYSFATKFCSFHDPSAYPIYDRNVGEALGAYRDRDGFAKFEPADLRNYGTFVSVLMKFQKAYGLDVSPRELDKFLWRVGADLKA